MSTEFWRNRKEGICYSTGRLETKKLFSEIIGLELPKTRKRKRKIETEGEKEIEGEG